MHLNKPTKCANISQKKSMKGPCTAMNENSLTLTPSFDLIQFDKNSKCECSVRNFYRGENHFPTVPKSKRSSSPSAHIRDDDMTNSNLVDCQRTRRRLLQSRSVRFASTKVVYQYESDKAIVTYNYGKPYNVNNNDSESCHAFLWEESSWLSRKDLRKIKHKNYLIVSLLLQGKFVEGRHSARGLEHLQKGHHVRERRKQIMTSAYHAVFDQQKIQQANGRYDPVAIAHVYRAVSSESQKNAHAMGITDMKESVLNSSSALFFNCLQLAT